MKQRNYSLFDGIYLSYPEISLPGNRVENEEIIAELTRRFSGEPEERDRIVRGLEKAFDSCGTKVRYIERDVKGKTGHYAAAPSAVCLEKNGVDPDDVDLVIFGSITRPYYEPAVANEIAGLLGMKRVHTFDISGACTTFVEAIYVGATFLAANQGLRNVLVCSSELPSENMDFEIKGANEIRLKASALTLGCGAAAMLLSRNALSPGFALHCCESFAIPNLWSLCVTPVQGFLKADSLGIYEAAKDHVPDAILNLLEFIRWPKENVKQVILHQAGNSYIKMVADTAKLREDQVLLAHQLFGNVGSATVMLALDHYLRTTRMSDGDKILLCAPGSGFAVVTAAIEMRGHAGAPGA